MVHLTYKKISLSIIAILSFFCLIFSTQNSFALTRIKDDTDLSRINLYQFTLTQENMEILNQGSSVVKDIIPPNGNRPKQSTVFSLKVDKSKDSQDFSRPLTLKFTNAGTVYGKTVDVYVTIKNVKTHLASKNGDYYNQAKTVVPFLTVDENWGTKSIQIMDYIYLDHANVTHDMYQTYWFDADVTAELKYQDGTPCDLKMVMNPSDIDVISGNLKESFSLYNINNTIDKIVENNANNLLEATTGNKTTWLPTDSAGTSGDWAEHNKTGLAVRSVDNKMSFSYGTTAVCGGLFGFYTEVPSTPPTKEVDKDTIKPIVGQELTYTAKYKMPVPGKDVIGDLTSMKMIDTFDERLDYKSLTVQLEGRTLTEGTDYTVTVEGQKVTVTIDQKHLVRGNGGQNYTITYKTVTNNKILQNGTEIKNRVTQEIDNVPSHSNTVTTKVLYKKTHEFISGTPGKNLPKAVLDLLPTDQLNIPNGTTVTPDQPKNGIVKVSVPEGNWIFKGYDKDSEVINNKDAHFIGKWVIEEYTKPVKDVQDASGTTINGKAVKSGDVLTYTISYTNTTDSDREVTITDTIPKLTTYVDSSADNGGVYAGGKLTWVKRVAKNETFKVTFKVKVNDNVDGKEITNIGHVSDGLTNVDTNPTNNPTPKKPEKDVLNDSNLSIDGKKVQWGQTLTYTVTYQNTTGEARDVTITDAIPEYTTYVSGSADNGGVFANGKLTWTKNVANGETFKVTFKVKVNDDANGKLIENTAQVVSGDNEVKTNTTKNPTPTRTSVKATKVWDDDNDKYKKRPQSIVVNLLADGKVIQTVTISADANGNWTHEFTNLPEYTSDGKKINYTVKENAVKGYDTTYSANNNGNITITNTVQKEYSLPNTGGKGVMFYMLAGGILTAISIIFLVLRYKHHLTRK